MKTYFWIIVCSPFFLAWALMAVWCWRRWKAPERPICGGCGCQVDPDICCCGGRMEGHQPIGHRPQPLGCQCGRSL